MHESLGHAWKGQGAVLVLDSVWSFVGALRK